MLCPTCAQPYTPRTARASMAQIITRLLDNSGLTITHLHLRDKRYAKLRSLAYYHLRAAGHSYYSIAPFMRRCHSTIHHAYNREAARQCKLNQLFSASVAPSATIHVQMSKTRAQGSVDLCTVAVDAATAPTVSPPTKSTPANTASSSRPPTPCS